MSPIHAKEATLVAHPSTPNDAVRALSARVRMEEADILILDYSLEADLSRLRIALPDAPGADVDKGGDVHTARVDALWKHTCFEAFLALPAVEGYNELNFSPSRDWAIYRFSAYREGPLKPEICHAPKISVHRGDGGVALEATVRLECCLADLRGAPRFKVGLAAVIEDQEGRLSYWAVRHAPGKPDFHHPSAFALEVARA